MTSAHTTFQKELFIYTVSKKKVGLSQNIFVIINTRTILIKFGSLSDIQNKFATT